VKVGPDLTFNGAVGYKDAWVAKVKADGTDLVYCGYIGGTSSEWGMDIAVDSYGNAYVVGYTVSDESSFPVKVGPDLTFNGNVNLDDRDAFVVKVMHCSLHADTYTVSKSTGGTINFTLDAGMDYANRIYLLLGSLSGTEEPGGALPGGGHLHLKWDAFTDLVFASLNTPFFSNFLGILNAQGQGTAQFNTLGPFYSSGVTHIFFAYAVNTYPWGYGSNPVEIEIVP
jgi:hypothetical protein